MQSTKPANEQEPYDTAINKTVDIAYLEFIGVYTTDTAGKIYTDLTEGFPIIFRKGTK